QRLDAGPPFLEGVDSGAIDERLEAARFQRRLETVDKRHVLAGIRDENLRRRWFSALLAGSIMGHGISPSVRRPHGGGIARAIASSRRHARAAGARSAP